MMKARFKPLLVGRIVPYGDNFITGAFSLIPPGTAWGPCLSPCDHESCRMASRSAASPCPACGKPPGFGVPIYDYPHRHGHAACFDEGVWAAKLDAVSLLAEMTAGTDVNGKLPFSPLTNPKRHAASDAARAKREARPAGAPPDEPHDEVPRYHLPEHDLFVRIPRHPFEARAKAERKELPMMPPSTEVVAPSSRPAAPTFEGCWPINWMKVWDQEATDTIGPAFISFTGSGGYFRFICVEGDLHCRFSVKRGSRHVEWTWNGQDERNPASGRGHATLQNDGSLKGCFYIHHGDDSDFTATKSERDLNTGSAPPPFRRRRR